MQEIFNKIPGKPSKVLHQGHTYQQLSSSPLLEPKVIEEPGEFTHTTAEWIEGLDKVVHMQYKKNKEKKAWPFCKPVSAKINKYQKGEDRWRNHSGS